MVIMLRKVASKATESIIRTGQKEIWASVFGTC